MGSHFVHTQKKHRDAKKSFEKGSGKRSFSRFTKEHHSRLSLDRAAHVSCRYSSLEYLGTNFAYVCIRNLFDN